MINLNYNTTGKGKPLVILHGLFGSSRNWNSAAKRLAVDYHVITVDMRNHGESGHAPDMTYPDMVADLDRLMTELALPEAWLLGHSMGGKAAMGFALTYPEKTAGLIVVDIAPVTYTVHHLALIEAMQSLPLEELAGRADAATILEEAGVEEPGIRQFLLQNLMRRDGGYAWRLNLEALRRHLDDLASFPARWPHAAYLGPARFLAGARSDYIQPRYYPAIFRLFPAASVQTIDDAGHWVHADQPEAFTEAVRDFMENGVNGES